MADTLPDLPIRVDSIDATALISRLKARHPLIRSVWFPTRNELELWRTAAAPLYLRPLSKTRFELGPKLENMWAACFSPVLVLTITNSEPLTLHWGRRLPNLTMGTIGFWWFILIGTAVSDQGTGEQMWWVAWAMLAASTVAAIGVGWTMGGKALDEAIPFLVDVIVAQDVDEDW